MSYYNRNVFFLFSDLSGDLEMLAFPSVQNTMWPTLLVG